MRYRYIDQLGTDIVVQFADKAKNGEHSFAKDSDANAMRRYTPEACLSESMSANDQKKIYCTAGELMPPGVKLQPGAYSFQRASPKFKDLAALAMKATDLFPNTLAMQLQANYTRVTDNMTAAYLTLQFNPNGQSNINVFTQITAIDRSFSTWFESNLIASPIDFHEVLLAPGVYRLNIAAKDSTANATHVSEQNLVVPSYSEDHLGASSLILADHLARVPTDNLGSSLTRFRTTEFRLRPDNTFKQPETMGIYTEFYNLGMDGITKKPKGTVEYQIVNNSDDKTVIDYTEDLADPKAFPNVFAVPSHRSKEVLAQIIAAWQLHIETAGYRQDQSANNQFFRCIHRNACMTFYAIFVLAASLTAFDNQPLLAQESIRRSLPRKKISGMQKQPAAALALQWQKWLNEDVRYINSDQEARAFKHLKTDRAAMFTSSTVRWMKSNRVALPIPGMHRHFRLNNGVIAKFALSDIFAVNKQ